MESIQTLSNQYALGHSQPELERLLQQGRFFGELTEYVLMKTGLALGMRVLDVGCGAGDRSFLARSPSGRRARSSVWAKRWRPSLSPNSGRKAAG